MSFGKRKLYLLQASLMTMKAMERFLLYDCVSMPREIWVHELLLERDQQSEFKLAESILNQGDEEKCIQYFRMGRDKFYVLLELVSDAIMKKDTNWRKSIPAKWRLIVTLRYLATGASQLHLSFSFRIGHRTVGIIVKECCKALWENLIPIVLQPPSITRWLEIEKEFCERWQCPNCIGALDGKHIKIKAPPNSGSLFFNYKGFFSIVLLAVCDAHYKFVVVDIGNTGRHSDGGVFDHSEIGKRFHQGSLNIPEPRSLPQSEMVLPLYFSGDDAFPLKVGLMKPFPGRNLPQDKQIFNYRLSRGRRVVENAFGILAVRWQIFYKTINCDPCMATKLVQACVVLHNFLQSCEPHSANPRHGRSSMTSVLDWRSTIPANINMTPLQPFGSNFYSREAGFFRNQLMQYFLTAGAVAWQGSNWQL